MDEPCDPLLAYPALAGNEYRGIDYGHPARQVHDLHHPGTLGDDPVWGVNLRRHPGQHSTAITELPFRGFQRLRDLAQRDVKALLETARIEEAQILHALLTPLLARAPQEIAGGVALAHAAILEDVDVFAGDATDIAAHQATDRPAHG